MGCDIHFFVEKKVNGKWESADTWEKDKHAEGESDCAFYVPYEKSYYSGRNYDLFAILANVRNGRGFAGVETGEGFNPISQPKGLPSDVSKEVKAESDSWDYDGHSHSYYTVRELTEFDWTQKTTCYGVIDARYWLRWQMYQKGQGNAPDYYCSYTNAETLSAEEAYTKFKDVIGREIVTWQDVNQILETVDKRKAFDFYVKDSWETTYSKTVGHNFFAETLPRLWKLGKPEDARIVFWFDN